LGEQFTDTFKTSKIDKSGGNNNHKRFESEIDGESRRSGDMSASMISKNILKDNDIDEENWNQQSQYEKFMAFAKPNKEYVTDLEPVQISAGFYHSLILVNKVKRDKFIQDCSKLYEEAETSGDVRFFVDGKTVKAHKFILMARCEVLHHMVSGPMLGQDYNMNSQDIINPNRRTNTNNQGQIEQANQAHSSLQNSQIDSSMPVVSLGSLSQNQSPPKSSSSTINSQSNITSIKIGTQVSYQSFCLLLEYLYTDDIHNLLYLVQKDLQLGLDLVCLADQYMIQRLKYLSEERIVAEGHIDLGSVCYLLHFASVQTA